MLFKCLGFIRGSGAARLLGFVAVIGFLAIAPAEAQKKTLYKWTDESGQVHYSERKPIGVDAEEFRVSSGGGSSTPASSAPAPNSQPVATTNTQSPDEESFKDPERCEVAKKNLEALNNNSRIRMKDPKTNEFRYLDTNEINEKKQEAQTAIGESC